MAAESTIARHFVELGVKGLGLVEGAFTRIKQGLAGVEKVGKAVAAGTQLAASVTQVASSFVGLAARIAEGTVEGDRLGAAWQFLGRVVKDMFAPYVRMLTQGLIELAQWWRSLDSDTKSTIAGWLAAGAAIAAFLALLPAVGV